MDVAVYRRNDLLLQVTVTDDTGAALDLTGAALTFVVEDAAGTEVISKSLGSGITVTNAAAGQIEITLTNTDTDLPSGDYRLELLVVDVEGARYTAATGTFTVKTSLTA